MRAATASRAAATVLPRSLPRSRSRKAVAPPVIMPATAPAAQPPPRYPAAVFGKLPAGFVLKMQGVEMLAHWHRKAMAAVDALPAGYTETDMDAAMAVANEVFEAIKSLKIGYASGVARQMSAVVERLNWLKNGEAVEEELTVAELKQMSDNLLAATALPEPTKRVGPLRRGRKLTRAGLLIRYQSFLVQELETIGWNLYGSRDYAMRFRPVDHAVDVRCGPHFVGGKYKPGRKSQPFFDESKLTVRARSVLRSLRIDTERNDDVPDRKPRNGGSR